MQAPTTKRKHDVFVSYHSGDADWVGALTKDLEDRGVSVWIDQKELRPGDAFVDVLEDALANIPCLLLVVSKGSMRSQWVREEYRTAMNVINTDTSRRIICALTDDAEPSGFAKNRTWVDFRDPADRAESLGLLVAGIKGDDEATRASRVMLDHLRGDPRSHSGPAHEIEYLQGQMKTTILELAAFCAAPLFAFGMGRWIAHGFQQIGGMPETALSTVSFAVPLALGFGMLGIVAPKIAKCWSKLARNRALRNGLRFCHVTTHPRCRRLRERFWENMLEEIGAP